MQKIYNYVSAAAILLLVIWIITLKGCNTWVSGVKTISSDTTTVVTDTLLVFERDTVYQEKIKYLTRTEIQEVRDTLVVVQRDTIRASIFEGVNRNKDVDIFYAATVEGRLLDMRLSYLFKKPLHITSNTVRERIITNTIKETKYKYGLYAGGGVGLTLNPINPRPQAFAGLMITTPKGWSYTANYDFLNQAATVDIKYRLGALFGR